MYNKLVEEYQNTTVRMLKRVYPQLSLQEIYMAVQYSINKRFKDTDVQVDNNYKKVTINSTLSKISDIIKTQRPILTSYGVMFKRHQKDKNNPFYDLLEVFIQNRTKFKNKMFEYPKGTEEFQKYNLLQLLAKLDANAMYGVLGQYSSLVYNLYLAQSITFQGRACISAAILFFESFMADNVQWACLNEIINFIDEVLHKDKRVFKDADILDRNITLEEVYVKIMKNCGFNGWYPNKRDMTIVWDILQRCSQEDLNRLYYRNNLYEFCSNSRIEKAIIYILSLLDIPFEDPNKPPKCIDVELNELLAMIKDYVYHPHLYMDRVDRIRMMNRSVSIITDTDSTIVSFDAWYRFILGKVGNLDLKVKHWVGKLYTRVEPDEFGDLPPRKLYHRVKKEYDYDFYKGDLVEVERNKKEIEPDTDSASNDNLRHSIINIMAYMISQLIGDYMRLLSSNYNSYDGSRPCLIVMKNEFLFKRVLVTQGKKNYASIQELQEGKRVPKEASLDVKGMPIDKSVLQANTRKRLKQILFDYILNAKEIDQVKVLKELAKTEREIYNSLMAGKKDYYKPVTIKSATSYENPMRIQGIKASEIYNYLKDENESGIDLEQRNSVTIVKLDLNIKNVSKIQDTFPETYHKMVELMKLEDFKDAIDYIAIPINAEVPEWIIPFIDYISIINDNLKNFPIECIGLSNHDRTSINYTNITSF